ncbi:hypothetical protein K9U40_20250 [Xanthobacter autotrophicus]|uniref:hypothetical protein n=1 Tax=Xanthobacter TaxID=279 RepID=UPI0024AA1B95|nr:hypothetical protein [Xanthobacter autotrophicus]MDI4666634.1 hypothetical protein [Xanthobacter autotrophicus]
MGDAAGSIAHISVIRQATTKEQFGHQPAALEVAGLPEFPRVSDETESGSITGLDIGQRTGASGQFFLQRDLALVQLPHLFLVERDEDRIAGGQQPLHELGLPALETRQFGLEGRDLLGMGPVAVRARLHHHRAKHGHDGL